jgi:acetyl esterase/lipase
MFPVGRISAGDGKVHLRDGQTQDIRIEERPHLASALVQLGQRRYLDGSNGLVSRVFADLGGLPPRLIQAGSHEILLDDAIGLAARAAADDVPVTFEITPGVPHLFQGFASILGEGDVALTRVAKFLRYHLTGAW